MSFRSGIWPYNVIHSGLHVKFWGFTASALRLRWPCVLSGLNYFILWWSAVERGWGWQMLDASDSRGISRWFFCGIYIHRYGIYGIYIYIVERVWLVSIPDMAALWLGRLREEQQAEYEADIPAGADYGRGCEQWKDVTLTKTHLTYHNPLYLATLGCHKPP